MQILAAASPTTSPAHSVFRRKRPPFGIEKLAPRARILLANRAQITTALRRQRRFQALPRFGVWRRKNRQNKAVITPQASRITASPTTLTQEKKRTKRSKLLSWLWPHLCHGSRFQLMVGRSRLSLLVSQ